MKVEKGTKGEGPSAHYRQLYNRLLTSEEERDYINAWKKKGDRQALHNIIVSHWKLVQKIASTFKGYNFDSKDLISEGFIGMLEAIKRFDPSKGYRFSTYAMWWIRAQMQRYVLMSWSLVKIGTTNAQKRLFFNVRSLKNKMDALDDASGSSNFNQKIAEKLQVSEQETEEMYERLKSRDVSLNAYMSSPNAESSGSEWQDHIQDESENQEEIFIKKDENQKHRQLMKGSLEKLDERARRIVAARHLKEPPLTLEELSKEFKVSRERVRQIETQALQKLSSLIKGNLR